MKKNKTIVTPTEKKVREIFIHEYKGEIQSVQIYVYINDVEGLIHIIDRNHIDDSIPMKPMSFQFYNRDISYMTGWQDILDGIKSAVAVAESKLGNYLSALEHDKSN